MNPVMTHAVSHVFRFAPYLPLREGGLESAEKLTAARRFVTSLCFELVRTSFARFRLREREPLQLHG